MHHISFYRCCCCFVQTPFIASIHPRIGPLSGGTHITLTGQHLDAGTAMSIMLSSSTTTTTTTTCELVSRDAHTAVCVTSSSRQPYLADNLQLKVDNAVIQSIEAVAIGSFTVSADPQIDTVDPERSIWSGGRSITVTGARLNTVHAPRMIVYFGNQNVTSVRKR